MAIRPSHPTVHRSGLRFAHIDVADSACKFIKQHDGVLRLNNLERIWHVRSPRHSGHVAFNFRVERQALREVFLLFSRHTRQIRDFTPLDNTQPRRSGPLRPESKAARAVASTW